MRKIIYINVLIILFIQIDALISEEKELASHNILIFPFFTAQENIPKDFLYLNYTISDVIKQEIIDKRILYLVEKNKVENLTAKLKMPKDFYTDELLRLKIAKKLKADFFCWGYFFKEQDNIIVYYHLVDTVTKRTKKIEKGEYKINIEIFKNIEEKAKNFAQWINISLPEYSGNQNVIFSKNNEENINTAKFSFFNKKLKRYL